MTAKTQGSAYPPPTCSGFLAPLGFRSLRGGERVREGDLMNVMGDGFIPAGSRVGTRINKNDYDWHTIRPNNSSTVQETT